MAFLGTYGCRSGSDGRLTLQGSPRRIGLFIGRRLQRLGRHSRRPVVEMRDRKPSGFLTRQTGFVANVFAEGRR
jgi:hypothetical protein